MKNFRIIKSAIALLMAAVLFCGCNVTDTRVNSGASTGGDSGAESEASASTGTTSSQSMEIIPPEETEPAYVAWMREEKVHEIRIEMDPAEWKKIRNNPYTGDYHAADVTIDGVLVKNVGVRTRGHGSLALAVEAFPYSCKYPLKIKFDKYDKDQTFMGLDELALNNGGDDFSYMRDYMGYEAYRLLGVDVSCVTYFNVYLNDELRGFYVGVESIDTSYLERLFDSHKHNLYEGESGASLTKYMPLSYLSQKKGKDESKEDVKRLINVLSETPLGEKGEIETILDVDSALRMLAVNAVLDNRDGYGGIYAHNYYLYNDNGKFIVLPWDMNAPNVSSWTDIASPTIGVYDYSLMNDRPLAKKLMAVDEYYAKYLDYCKQLAEKLPELKETVLRLYGMIKDSVEADKNKFCTNNIFNAQFRENNSYGTVYFLTKRYDYLMDRLPKLEGKPASQTVLNPPPPPPPAPPSSSSSGTGEQQTDPTEGGDPSGEATEGGEPSGEPTVPAGGENPEQQTQIQETSTPNDEGNSSAENPPAV